MWYRDKTLCAWERIEPTVNKSKATKEQQIEIWYYRRRQSDVRWPSFFAHRQLGQNNSSDVQSVWRNGGGSVHGHSRGICAHLGCSLDYFPRLRILPVE